MSSQMSQFRQWIPWYYTRIVACVVVLCLISATIVIYRHGGARKVLSAMSSPKFHYKASGQCCPCEDKPKTNTPQMIQTNDTSKLEQMVNDTQEIYKVPNIVHYTWYAEPSVPMTFKQYIGVLSAHKILKPDKIYIHTNISRAAGTYWDKIVALDTVEVLHDGSPTQLFEKVLVHNDTEFFSDFSDIGRVKYLLKYGGIYLDYDVFVIQSFDKLRMYEFTMGQEQDRSSSYDLLNAGIIIASRQAPFLYLWACGYVDDYRPKQWVYNSGWKPTMLWKRFSHLIHVETTKLNRPNWRPGEVDKIWGNQTFNWRENYALHTWYRYRTKVEAYQKQYNDLAPDEKDVMTMNNTYAEIARYILSL